MKAQVGDYIRTANGLRKVVRSNADNGYELEDGQTLADSDIALDDVLLESEVTT